MRKKTVKKVKVATPKKRTTTPVTRKRKPSPTKSRAKRIVKKVSKKVVKKVIKPKAIVKRKPTSPSQSLGKTPITYYGGKQSMVKDILPMIPEHRVYTEAFFGGGAIYFAKEPASVLEVINDQNGEVINFYRVIKSQAAAFKKLAIQTLHSRALYAEAMNVYKSPTKHTALKRAWAFWVLTNQGFVSKIGSWGYDRQKNSMTRKVQNKKMMDWNAFAKRLERTEIECNDAIKVIKSRDTVNTFHYVDPPYIDTHQGHYKGYTKEDFEELLQTLAAVKGKFLLSSYPSTLLNRYKKKYKWNQKRFNKPLAAGSNGKRKIEVLTWNY
ncbi:MAG: DNA adenine methylase [Cyclobacteriaceae bacterium]